MACLKQGGFRIDEVVMAAPHIFGFQRLSLPSDAPQSMRKCLMYWRPFSSSTRESSVLIDFASVSFSQDGESRPSRAAPASTFMRKQRHSDRLTACPQTRTGPDRLTGLRSSGWPTLDI